MFDDWIPLGVGYWMHSFEELLIGISGSSRYLQGYNRYERRTWRGSCRETIVKWGGTTKYIILSSSVFTEDGGFLFHRKLHFLCRKASGRMHRRWGKWKKERNWSILHFAHCDIVAYFCQNTVSAGYGVGKGRGVHLQQWMVSAGSLHRRPASLPI